ncbi:hypothetical protein HN958_02675 [Candidatus Falkowbacteria bacterium]|nr:hypothetical protein [Candidatus Falkowbacteria bacterium]MBT7007386.1 hypothetical protein [Candidatus Falkowbacteria bacterium]
MANILLVVADAKHELPTSVAPNDNLNFLETGIGPQNTFEILEAMLVTKHFTHIVCTGFCGSVRDDLPVGTIVIPTAIRTGDESLMKQHAVIAVPARPRLITNLEGCSVREGQMHSFSQVVTGRKTVHPDAIAVDMEMYSVAVLARQHEVSFIGGKVVSDIVPVTEVSPEQQVAQIRQNMMTAKPFIYYFWSAAKQFIQDQ